MNILKSTLAIAILVCLFPLSGQAEDNPLIDLLTSKRAPDCPEYIYNAKLLIPRYFSEGKQDSIGIILNFVEANCCAIEFQQFEILSAIENGEFDSYICNLDLINLIIKPGISRYSTFDPFEISSIYFDYLSSCITPVDSTYEKFQYQFNMKLLQQTDTNSVEHLFCRYFNGETDYIIARLKKKDFEGECIQTVFDEALAIAEKDIYSSRLYWSINTGVWVPLGNNDILGVKPEIGLQYGIRRNRWGGDMVGWIRFIKSKNEYMVGYYGEQRATKKFTSYNIGLYLSYEILRFGRNSTEIISGLAYDAIEATYDDDDDNNKLSLDCFNASFGMTHRICINKQKSHFIGIQVRYNIVDYPTHGGTDLSGNTLSINLVGGFVGNSWAINRAERFGIFD